MKIIYLVLFLLFFVGCEKIEYTKQDKKNMVHLDEMAKSCWYARSYREGGFYDRKAYEVVLRECEK